MQSIGKAIRPIFTIRSHIAKCSIGKPVTKPVESWFSRLKRNHFQTNAYLYIIAILAGYFKHLIFVHVD